jgi:hypothetical protein
MNKIYIDLRDIIQVGIVKDKKLAFYSDYDYDSGLEKIYSDVYGANINLCVLLVQGFVSDRAFSDSMTPLNLIMGGNKYYSNVSKIDVNKIKHLCQQLGIPKMIVYDTIGMYDKVSTVDSLVIDTNGKLVSMYLKQNGERSIQYTSLQSAEDTIKEVAERHCLPKVLAYNYIQTEALDYFHYISEGDILVDSFLTRCFYCESKTSDPFKIGNKESILVDVSNKKKDVVNKKTEKNEKSAKINKKKTESKPLLKHKTKEKVTKQVNKKEIKDDKSSGNKHEEKNSDTQEDTSDFKKKDIKSIAINLLMIVLVIITASIYTINTFIDKDTAVLNSSKSSLLLECQRKQEQVKNLEEFKKNYGKIKYFDSINTISNLGLPCTIGTIEINSSSKVSLLLYVDESLNIDEIKNLLSTEFKMKKATPKGSLNMNDKVLNKYEFILNNK